MYEDKYYNAYFITTIKTPDDKSISEMSYSELYWLEKNLNSHVEDYVKSIKDEIKNRREELYDKSREEAIHKLADKYLEIIEAGCGRKCKKNHWKAYDILLDIFFHKTDD